VAVCVCFLHWNKFVVSEGLFKTNLNGKLGDIVELWKS
jgi:hypothetical protein